MRKIWVSFILLAAIFSFTGITSAAITINSIDEAEYPIIQMVFTGPKDLTDITIRETRWDINYTQGPFDYFSPRIKQSAKPLALVLVIDVSDSMGTEIDNTTTTVLDSAKEAASGLIDKLEIDDQVAVIFFNENVNEANGGSFYIYDEFVNAKDTINSLSVGGSTALYDAMQSGVQKAVETESSFNKVVLVLSDGNDTSSGATMDEVINSIDPVKNTIAVYNVFIDKQDVAGGSNTDTNPLKEIATLTSQFYYKYTLANAAETLSDIFNDIYDHFTNQAEYTVQYVTDNFRAESFCHDITIQASVQASGQSGSKKYCEPQADMIFVHGFAPSPFDLINNASKARDYWGGDPYIKEAIKTGEWKGIVFSPRKYVLTHRNGQNGLHDQAIELVNQLDNGVYMGNVSTQEAIYVAHSMGGLVMRYIIAQANDPGSTLAPLNKYKFKLVAAGIGKVISLNTPHYGSPEADIIADAFSAVYIDTDAIRDLQRTSMADRNTNEWFTENSRTIVSNNIPHKRGIPFYMLGGRRAYGGLLGTVDNFVYFGTPPVLSPNSVPNFYQHPNSIGELTSFDDCSGKWCGQGLGNFELDNDGIVDILSGIGVNHTGSHFLAGDFHDFYHRFEGPWHHTAVHQDKSAAEWVKSVATDSITLPIEYPVISISDDSDLPPTIAGNLIRAPYDLTDNSWKLYNLMQIDYGHLDPDGGQTASKVTHAANSGSASLMAMVGEDIPENHMLEFSVWLKADFNTYVALSLAESRADVEPRTASLFDFFVGTAYAAEPSAQSHVSVTTTWQKFTLRGMFSNVTSESGPAIGGLGSFTDQDAVIYVWNPTLIDLDDCDGSVDEGFTRVITCGVGECEASGTETCTNGVWVSDPQNVQIQKAIARGKGITILGNGFCCYSTDSGTSLSAYDGYGNPITCVLRSWDNTRISASCIISPSSVTVTSPLGYATSRVRKVRARR